MSSSTISSINKYLLSSQVVAPPPPPPDPLTISNKLMFLSFDNGAVVDHWGSQPFTIVGAPVSAAQKKFGNNSLTSNHTANTSIYTYTTNTLFASLPSGITVSFWIRINAFTGTGDTKVFEIGGNDRVFLWSVSGTNNYAFSYGTQMNLTSYIGTWVHFCVTITSASVYNVYLNGVFLHTFTGSGKYPTTNSRVYIGASTTRAHRSINGFIDHFKIWTKILNTTEITAVYYNVDI